MSVCTRELNQGGRCGVGEESEGAVGVEIQIKMMGEKKRMRRRRAKSEVGKQRRKSKTDLFMFCKR